MALSDDNQVCFDFGDERTYDEKCKEVLKRSAERCNTIMRNRDFDIEYTGSWERNWFKVRNFE